MHAADTNTSDNEWANCIGALGLIHSEPEMVVPALIKSMHDPRQLGRLPALYYLGNFGRDAKSATSDLIELLKDEDEPLGTRNLALRALSRIYDNPEWDLPIKTMRNYRSDYLVPVIRGLGALRTDAEAAVPALVKLLADPDEGVRVNATNALQSIDPEAAAKSALQ